MTVHVGTAESCAPIPAPASTGTTSRLPATASARMTAGSGPPVSATAPPSARLKPLLHPELTHTLSATSSVNGVVSPRFLVGVDAALQPSVPHDVQLLHKHDMSVAGRVTMITNRPVSLA